MKGIVSYHLIHIAAFLYSKCNIDGHCQFIGHNGNGKTTNLRVPLYFYNPSGDSRDHAIERSKYSFNDFYFKGERSFIVYEVCRGKLPDRSWDLYHIAVNRKSGAPRFTFIDAPFDKQLFQNANGHICNERELLGNLQIAGIKSESVNSYEAYRSIIYGADYHPRFKRFVYAFPKANTEKHLRTIPKILSAIFRAENSKTETLKDALIASLGEEEASIDLRQTGKEMKQFKRDREELMLLEAQIGRITTICSSFAEYKDYRADSHNIVRRIHECLPRAEHCVNMESVSIQTLEAELLKAEKDFEKAIEQVTEALKECTLREGSLTQTLEAIREIQKQYPEETLKAWEKSERDLPTLNQTFEKYDSRLSVLNKHNKDVQEKYKALEERTRTSFGKLHQEAIDTYQTIAIECTKQIGILHDESRTMTAELRASFDAERERLNQLESDLRVKETDFKRLKERLRLDDFRGPAIRDLRTQCSKLKSELAINQSESKSLLEKHQAIGHRRESRLLQIGQKFDPQIQQWEAEAANLQAQIDRLLPIIDRYAGSLLEAVDLEGVQPEIFRAVVNETVLLERAESLIKQGEQSPKTALLGLHIDTESLPAASELSLEAAKQKLATLTTGREAFEAKIAKEKSSKQEELDVLGENHQLALKEHQKFADHVRSESRRLLSELEASQETLDSELELQKEEFAAKLKELESAHREASQDHIRATKKRKEYGQLCFTQEAEVKQRYDHKIETTQKEEQAAALRRDTELQSIEKRLDHDLEELNSEKAEELKAGSDQPNEIARIQELFDHAEKSLETAKDDAQKLAAYREHSLPTVEKLPETLSSLEDNNAQKSELEGKKESETERLKQQKEQIDQKLGAHKDRHKKATDDIEAFHDWTAHEEEDTTPTITEKTVFNYAPGDIQLQIVQHQQTKNRMHDLWSGKPDTRTSQIHDCGIKRNVEYLVSLFKEGNRFNFPRTFEVDEDVREFIDYKLSIMLSTDSLDKERKQVLEAFRLTMRNLSREYEQLEDSKARLSRILGAIQRSIANDGIFVASINSIEFDLQNSKSRASALRETLKTCLERLDPSRIDLDTAQSDLFAHKPTMNEIVSLMDQVQTISDEINDHNIERIRLGDLVDFVIRITENGISHGWKPLIQGVGSEGTGALAKFIIYSGILSHFKKAVYKNADELHLHCTIDEIGKIYAGYVTELLNYCRKLGIYLATAQPNTHSKPGDFERTFIIDRNEKTQRARVTPVIEAKVRIG